MTPLGVEVDVVGRDDVELGIMMPKQRKEKLDPPILIIGYMHSGTTLLQQILGRHQDVFISGGETRFFANLASTTHQYPDLGNDDTLRNYVKYLLKVIFTGYARVNFTKRKGYSPVRLEDFELLPEDLEQLYQVARDNRSYTDLYLIVFDFLTRKRNKRRWLDKLPGDVSQFDQMSAVVHNAQVIELIRDPRDILASKKRRSELGWNYDPIWDSIAWKTAVRAGEGAQRKSPNSLIRVRYEDLVTRPDETTRTICQFLGLQFHADMLSVGSINSTTAQTTDMQAQISTAPVGKWKQILPPAHAAVCQQITKSELAKNDYMAEAVAPTTYLFLPVLLLRSAAEFFHRLYSRWRLGGIGFMRSILSSYRARLLSLLRP